MALKLNEDRAFQLFHVDCSYSVRMSQQSQPSPVVSFCFDAGTDKSWFPRLATRAHKWQTYLQSTVNVT